MVLSATGKSREEVWNWFSPINPAKGPDYQNRYNFMDSWIRVGLGYQFDGIKAFAELMLRALRVMQQADVVLYDSLVSREVLERPRSMAECIVVGKSKGFHTRSQDEINALMVKWAKAGQVVVRLKSGDPMIFGRGGEELTYLKARGILVEVVPGITAALAGAAYAGILLTERHTDVELSNIYGP